MRWIVSTASRSPSAGALPIVASVLIHLVVIGVLASSFVLAPEGTDEGAGLTVTAVVNQRDEVPEERSPFPEQARPEPLDFVPEPVVPDAAPLPPYEVPDDELERILRAEPALADLSAPSIAAAGALARSRRHRPPAPSPAPPPARPERPVAVTPLVPVYHPVYYPLEARGRRLRGLVEVEVLISAEGRVVRAELATSSGYQVLDEAAITAARQWRFRPPGRLRRAVIPFRFSPD